MSHLCVGGGKMLIVKLKRLIFPCAIFSLLFIVLFKQDATLKNVVLGIIMGTNHMWFLPMLFWCFCLTWLLKELKIPINLKMLLVVVLSLTSTMYPSYFRLNKALLYLPFFYWGFEVWRYKISVSLNDLISFRWVLNCWILFLISFSAFSYFTETESDRLYNSIIISLIDKIWHLLNSVLGCLAIFITAKRITRHKILPRFICSVSNCSFGIYLFQEFVLRMLFYHTSLSTVVSPYILLWLAMLITFFVSYILTALMRNTKYGRMLV